MIRDVVIFSAGAAIGSIVTWKLIEAKYKQIADESMQRYNAEEYYKNIMRIYQG